MSKNREDWVDAPGTQELKDDDTKEEREAKFSKWHSDIVSWAKNFGIEVGKIRKNEKN